jgi:hypothetical protein
VIQIAIGQGGQESIRDHALIGWILGFGRVAVLS